SAQAPSPLAWPGPVPIAAAMAERSSFHLPRCEKLACLRVLGILEHNAHGVELGANAIRLGEILGLSRRRACRDEIDHAWLVDRCRRSPLLLPFRPAGGEQPEHL